MKKGRLHPPLRLFLLALSCWVLVALSSLLLSQAAPPARRFNTPKRSFPRQKRRKQHAFRKKRRGVLRGQRAGRRRRRKPRSVTKHRVGGHGHHGHSHSSVHSRLFAYRKREQAVLEQLAKLDLKRLGAGWRLYKLQQEILDQKDRITTLRQSRKTQLQISKMMVQRIRPRLRMAYRLSRLGKARLLLGASNFRVMAQRWQRLKHLATLDVQLINNYQRIQEHLRRLQVRAASETRRLKKLEKKLRIEKKSLESMRSQVRAKLLSLYKEAQKYKEVVQRLYGSQRRLQVLLQSWQESRNLKGLWPLRGRLRWPIPQFSRRCGQYRIHWKQQKATLRCLTRLKQPRALKDSLGRQGWSFAVPTGTPVVAVAKGKVVLQRWEPGYGRMYILEHGQRFYSVYAHLAQWGVQLGETVQAGQALGLAGNSGLQGRARLYFELRFQARLLNPTNWLRAEPQL